MVTTEVLNPHSEVEIEKVLWLELLWFGSEAAEKSEDYDLRMHCHKVKGLLADLDIERAANRRLRSDAKGNEIESPLARSWHK